MIVDVEMIETNCLERIHIPRDSQEPVSPSQLQFLLYITIEIDDDHKCLISYHNIAPDDRESLKTGQRSLKAEKVKPFHVSGHLSMINKSWPKLGIQYAKFVDSIAPWSPNLYLTVKSHDKKR